MRIMLKAIQILGSSSSSSSSGFVFFCALRKPPHPNSALSFISIKPSPASSKSTLPALLPRRRSTSTGFRMYSSCRRDSNPAGTSSLSPSGGVASCFSASSGPFQPPIGVHKIKFCQSCGGPMKHEVPNGEERERAICTVCGGIAYENPKMDQKVFLLQEQGEILGFMKDEQLRKHLPRMFSLINATFDVEPGVSLETASLLSSRGKVVGCLIEHDNKILLCKRNIQPSHGLWTLPAGYLEMGESTVEGAMRETWEEAGAEVDIISPFTQLDIPLIGQTYIIFLAKLKRPHFSPGPESSECRLFELGEIPFESLAFSSMLVTLELFIEDRKAGKPMFHYGIINKRPGTSPSEIRAYTLDHHFQC